MTDIVTNGARDVPCFACRNSRRSDKHVPREGGGFHHQYWCVKGFAMPDSDPLQSDADQVVKCAGGDPREGFQIGGYYSHMWFERKSEEPNACLDWMIASNGEFPTADDSAGIKFHICDFRQIERFVAFWGKELRRRGWVTSSENEE
jgi:hypothetical protein